MKITSPIYLLRSHETCWKCGSNQQVIAFATASLLDDEEDGDPETIASQEEPVLLDNIEEMPAEFLIYLRAAHPLFQKRMSKTAGHSYYMNTCPCGAHFGDFYLFSEPGGAFFPDTIVQAKAITIEELPFDGTFDFLCSYSMGVGGFIFEHAQRQRRE